MGSGRMVPLTSVRSAFHGRVLAARLGADGILTELRGAVDGPYPMGDVVVYVEEADSDLARELLLVDEVESAMGGDTEHHTRTPPLWVVLTVVALVVGVLLTRVA